MVKTFVSKRLWRFSKLLSGFAITVLAYSPAACLGGYTPPTGIPAPSFGIDQDVTMYSGQTYDFGSGPVPYPNAGNGPYTHYIDNTAPNATDSNNPYGTPALPRKTIPYNVAAGSVLEIHGGPYSTPNGPGGMAGKQCVNGAGTADKPIFVRGIPGNPATLGADLWPLGTYMIFENFKGFRTGFYFRHDLLPSDIEHVCVRYSEFYGDNTETYNHTALSIGPFHVNYPDKQISDIVLYDNYIHNLGKIDPNIEYDYTACEVSGYNVYRVWYLNNLVQDTSSAGIRTGNESGWTPAYSSTNTYVGGNTILHTGENAVAIKIMANAVVSENYCRTFAASKHNSGAALDILFYPINVWLINNDVGDAEIGIKCSGTVDSYFIGNLVTNSHYGIEYWSTGYIGILNNTLEGCTQYGIDNFSDGATDHRPILNNVIHLAIGNNGGQNYHFYIQNDTHDVFDNNDFWQDTGSYLSRWGGAVYSSLAAFQVATGKGAHCLTVDPQFRSPPSDLVPLPGSPLIGGGADITYWTNLFTSRFGTTIMQDANHTPRSSANPSIGALEPTTATPTPTPTITPSPTPTATPEAPQDLRVIH